MRARLQSIKRAPAVTATVLPVKRLPRAKAPAAVVTPAATPASHEPAETPGSVDEAPAESGAPTAERAA